MNDSGYGPSSDGPTVVVDDRRDWDPATLQRLVLLPGPQSLGGLLGAVLRAEGVPRAAEAGLHLVGETEMTELNRDAMGIDGPTDVLSFPVDGGIRDQEHLGMPQLVGDVVLCAEVAQCNAAEHAGSVADECRLLVVHGALHLCGWDHSTPGDRDNMWRRELELMVSFGVEPLGDPWTRS